jgi:hypothetical protein
MVTGYCISSFTSDQSREIVNYNLRNSNNWLSFKCRTDRFKLEKLFPKYHSSFKHVIVTLF